MITEMVIGETEDVGGMSDEMIDAKHIRMRGSLDLKYPRREASCRKECGVEDYYKVSGRPPESHRCFLTTGHKELCEFSSECGR